MDPFAVTDSLKFLSDDVGDLLANARLRTPGELHACRELMHAVHCRLRDFLRNGEPKDFSTWLDDDWLTTLGLSGRGLIADGDLGIEGKPLATVPSESVKRCEWATRERHRASIWLIGEEHPSYWDWGVDT